MTNSLRGKHQVFTDAIISIPLSGLYNYLVVNGISFSYKGEVIINVLSLFDGMSCGQIALDKLGIEADTYYASEIDKYAIQVTNKNYPDTVHLGDVTTWKDWDLSKIDLLIGGSPCQGFSFAGKQLNFNDPRSALFFTYVDILKEIKPKYFLLENVKMKKESEDIISEYLGVKPIKINSSLVSGQMRDRLYWTNIPDVTVPVDKGILLRDMIEDGYVDRDKSYCIDANYFKGGNLKQYFEKSRRQLVFNKNVSDTDISEIEWRKLTPTECERLQTVPVKYTEGVSNTQRYKMLGNGWTVDVIAHILGFMELENTYETSEELRSHIVEVTGSQLDL